MNITTDQIQRDIRTRLLAYGGGGSLNLPALTGLDVLIEHDPDADAEALEAFESNFERILASKGLLLAVQTPHYVKLDAVERHSIAKHAVVVVVVFENPKVNRAAGGHGLTPGLVLDSAQMALLPRYGFDAEPMTPPARVDELYTRGLVVTLPVEREIA